MNTCYGRCMNTITYPVRKITLAEPTDRVPGVGAVANGGSTITYPCTPQWQANIDRDLARGCRLIREWWVTECAGGCTLLMSIDNPEEVPVCRDCGIAAMEYKHGGDWDSYR